MPYVLFRGADRLLTIGERGSKERLMLRILGVARSRAFHPCRCRSVAHSVAELLTRSSFGLGTNIAALLSGVFGQALVFMKYIPTCRNLC